MRNARIRLVLNKKLEEHEISAANEAAGRFKAFGLGVETVNDPSEVWKDLTRLKFFQMVLGEGPITLFGEEPLGRPLSASRIPHDGAILAGLTSEKMSYSTGGRTTTLEGVSLQYVGGIFSVSNFRPVRAGDPYRSASIPSQVELSAAIELGFAHEIGHALLGRKPIVSFGGSKEPERYDSDGHCLSSGCLMQNMENYVKFLRTLGDQKIDFCEGCSYLIRGRVSELQWYGAA